MIEATVNWTDKDRFVGLASSRHSMVMDAGAEKTANSPMELVLIALCGCTASDVIGILRKKREQFTALEVTRLYGFQTPMTWSVRAIDQRTHSRNCKAD